MTYHLLYESCGWHTRCALFDGKGKLLTLRIDDISRPLIEGALVWGRVRQVVPSLGAAFVDIGDVQDGLLGLNTLPNGSKLTEGQGVLVQVLRGGFGEKGARLTARVAHKAEVAVGAKPHVVKPAPHALKRSLRDAGSHPVQVWLPHGMYRDTVAAVVPDRQIHQLNSATDGPDLLDALDDVLARIATGALVFPFPNGDVRVELTSAVATVDVNFRPLHGAEKADAVMAANLAAADEVARLVRLLDLGGSVVVDFITPKSKAQRDVVDDHLHAALTTTDEHFEHLRAMSANGLSEITRTRSGPSIMLLLTTAPYVAGAIALELWRTPAGRKPAMHKQVVKVNPRVAELLQPRLPQDECLRLLGRTVTVLPEFTRALPDYSIEG